MRLIDADVLTEEMNKKALDLANGVRIVNVKGGAE